MPNKEQCNCVEMTCLSNCDRNHTHKTFWCEKCNPGEQNEKCNHLIESNMCESCCRKCEEQIDKVIPDNYPSEEPPIGTDCPCDMGSKYHHHPMCEEVKVEDWVFANNIAYKDSVINTKIYYPATNKYSNIKSLLAQERKRVISEATQTIRDYLLCDWSGEAEVYAEIENIAKRVELLSALKE